MLIWEKTDGEMPHDLFCTLRKRAYRTSLEGEQRLRNKKQKTVFKYPETRTCGRTTHGMM